MAVQTSDKDVQVESHQTQYPYAQRFMVHIPQPDNPEDAFGYPSRIKIKDALLPHIGWHEYVTRKVALLRKAESGKVYCSRCGRELKRDYMFSSSWNFCPRCGAEILR